MNPSTGANYRDFEREVAAIYRVLGAKVEHDVSIAGNQIDILTSETTPSGSTVRSAIECKAYSRPVGIDVVNGFVVLLNLLRDRLLVEKGFIVALNGFTTSAREAARQGGVELVQIDDLRQRIKGREGQLRSATARVIEDEAVASRGTRQKAAFVLMPFTQTIDDLYVLGIREVAERLHITVERADNIEHNAGILEMIQQRIQTADVIVAEVSDRNPNVMYEVGYCHALEKSTVLISRRGSTLASDLSNINHLLYDSIVDLRTKLESRLKAVLSL